ncbi:MAG: barstar family protein [Burkholderiaceae bacterium]|nr:barstar family protein [Burkholderiaceae bacterium]
MSITTAHFSSESLFANVPPNLVQSIRAFRVVDLQAEAARLGQHFLYAHCSGTNTKQQVLTRIAESFHFPKYFGKNFDALADCLTDLTHKAGAQPGFVVVLEHLPETAKFDKEAREKLLDVFRDAADFWGDKKVQFRVFYSFE